MRLLITADPQVPNRARDLPPALWDDIARADVLVHAGDWVSVDLLDPFESPRQPPRRSAPIWR